MRGRACVTVLVLGVALMWLVSGTLREGPLCDARPAEQLRSLEVGVAVDTNDVGRVLRLGQAYLDAQEPGLAIALLESSPASVRTDARAEHVLARALLDHGQNERALEVESRVLATCDAAADVTGAEKAAAAHSASVAAGCDEVLLASAKRRASILREMVRLGVRDALARPEASLIAYRKATRETRIRVE
jgi:hypothetical protein